MVNVLSVSEMDKRSVGKLRDVGRLYQLEDESGIAQIELGDRKIGKLRKIEKKRERKYPNFKNRKKRGERIEFANKEIKKGNRKERSGRTNSRPIGKYGGCKYPNRYFGGRISKIGRK